MIDLLDEDVQNYVRIEQLSENNIPSDFPMKESKYKIYTDYLLERALQYQSIYITNTFLLIDKETDCIIAYISLICDSITVTSDEKNENSLETVPFSTFPAIKIAQLAVSSSFENKYLRILPQVITF